MEAGTHLRKATEILRRRFALPLFLDEEHLPVRLAARPYGDVVLRWFLCPFRISFIVAAENLMIRMDVIRPGDLLFPGKDYWLYEN
jgi:hypothetical protein